MKFKQWQARGDLKIPYKAEKARIQKEIWEQLKLRVDYPNPTGGTSNDGNTARRAFQNFKTFARILNVREDIVRDFRTVLITLSSQFPINPGRFKVHCISLFNKLMDEYSWYLLPSSIHKILIHGAEIISASPLPVGMLAEDCAESRNKCYKFDRTYRARKTSRLDTLTDMFHRSLGTSDPLISSISLRRRAIVRKRKTLPAEVIDLLDETECGLTPVRHDEYNMTDLPDAVEENMMLEIECDL
ncbi:unnamed protein product [Allacma fusca]|uniref:Uncharacterized protein n=1 Tax=Allacma fusca TaxID=39272 RepID=A0A8J2KM41_9HEXA|nr:unnamed protein product [Allacma fusca]